MRWYVMWLSSVTCAHSLACSLSLALSRSGKRGVERETSEGGTRGSIVFLARSFSLSRVPRTLCWRENSAAHSSLDAHPSSLGVLIQTAGTFSMRVFTIASMSASVGRTPSGIGRSRSHIGRADVFNALNGGAGRPARSSAVRPARRLITKASAAFDRAAYRPLRWRMAMRTRRSLMEPNTGWFVPLSSVT